MKTMLIAAALALCTASACRPAQALDEKNMLSIQASLSDAHLSKQLQPEIQLVFGKTEPQNITQRFGDQSFKRHTTRTPYDPVVSCPHAFLAALVNLQTEAKKRGANAVINITSGRPPEFASDKEYECYRGRMATEVILKGEFVMLGQ